jgi:hypothetical protein
MVSVIMTQRALDSQETPLPFIRAAVCGGTEGGLYSSQSAPTGGLTLRHRRNGRFNDILSGHFSPNSLQHILGTA